MKTKHNLLSKISLSALLLLAVSVAGCASSSPRVTEEREFIQLHHVANTGEALNLKKGDAIAMACTKCKTVLYANVEKPRTRFFVPLEHRHYCPGCNSTITTTGAGFNSKEEVKHTCAACGSDSVFCCATKTGSDSMTGMEKEKK
jgi:hypothetical protein